MPCRLTSVSSDDSTMSFSNRQFCHRLLKQSFSQRQLRTSGTHLEYNLFFFQALQARSDTCSNRGHTPRRQSGADKQERQSSAHTHGSHGQSSKQQPAQSVSACLQCKQLGSRAHRWRLGNARKAIFSSLQFSRHYFQKPFTCHKNGIGGMADNGTHGTARTAGMHGATQNHHLPEG